MPKADPITHRDFRRTALLRQASVLESANILALLLCVASLVGCAVRPGSVGTSVSDPVVTVPSASEFAASFRQATDRLQARTEAIQAQGRAALAAKVDVAGIYAEMLDAARGARADYAAIVPPPELESDMGHLVEVLDQQTRSLEALLTAMQAQDTAAQDAPLQALGASLVEMATTLQTIERGLSPNPK